MANGDMDIQARIQDVRNRVEDVRPDLIPQLRDAVQSRIQRRGGPLSRAPSPGGLLEQATGGPKGQTRSPQRGEKFRGVDEESPSTRRKSSGSGDFRSVT